MTVIAGAGSGNQAVLVDGEESTMVDVQGCHMIVTLQHVIYVFYPAHTYKLGGGKLKGSLFNSEFYG